MSSDLELAPGSGPRSPQEVAKLFEIAHGETDAIRQLNGCVEALHEVQEAKQALMTLTPGEVRAALEHRRLEVGEAP
jgi:hypothetical protein